MSIKERINKIKSEVNLQNLRESEEERKEKEAQDLKEENLLKDCVKSLEIFGINKALSEVNQEIMNSGGKIEQFSGIEHGYHTWESGENTYTRYYRDAVARTALTWYRGGKLYEMGAVAIKHCLTDYPFTIRLYYPECERDYTTSLQVDNIRGREHFVTGGRIVEHTSTYPALKINEACQDKIASICIHLKEQGLL